MKQISVIIPVYNVAPYLEQCMRSVLNQTYTNMEILIVDDGSTDGSSLICDELKKTDGRIQVFHQKNAGVSSARNVGISHASGEYISFIDPDDFIEPAFYEILVKNIEECHAQCSSVGHMRLYEETGSCVVVSPSGERRVQGGLEAMDETYSQTDPWVGMPVNKLYLRDIIEKHQLKFREDMCYNEDNEFTYRYLSYCDISVREPIPLYTYRIRRSSATFSMFSSYENSKKVCYSADIIFEYASHFKERVFFEKIACYYVKVYAEFVYYMFLNGVYDENNIARAKKNIFSVKKELPQIDISFKIRLFLLGINISPKLTYFAVKAMRGKKRR